MHAKYYFKKFLKRNSKIVSHDWMRQKPILNECDWELSLEKLPVLM